MKSHSGLRGMPSIFQRVTLIVTHVQYSSTVDRLQTRNPRKITMERKVMADIRQTLSPSVASHLRADTSFAKTSIIVSDSGYTSD